MGCGFGRTSEKCAVPFTGVSDHASICMAYSGLIHGPPLMDHAAQLWLQCSTPNRDPSLDACLMHSRHFLVMKGVGPAGMSTSTLKICAPPIPALFMASRSAVIPSLEIFPLHQCHQVWGL